MATLAQTAKQTNHHLAKSFILEIAQCLFLSLGMFYLMNEDVHD